MTDHDDIRSLLGVYALDAIDDPEELRSVELHLTECAECRAEVDAHRTVTSAMAEAGLETPPGLWTRIEGGLEADPVGPGRNRWQLHNITSIAAVAAIAAAIGMGALWSAANGDVLDLRERVGELEATVAQAEAALDTTDPVDLAVQRARSAGRYWHTSRAPTSGPPGRSWVRRRR